MIIMMDIFIVYNNFDNWGLSSPSGSWILMVTLPFAALGCEIVYGLCDFGTQAVRNLHAHKGFSSPLYVMVYRHCVYNPIYVKVPNGIVGPMPWHRQLLKSTPRGRVVPEKDLVNTCEYLVSCTLVVPEEYLDTNWIVSRYQLSIL